MVINKINFEIKGDSRGSLISLESQKNIPFEIKRIYYIFGNEPSVSRGFHAHKNLRQVAVVVNGSCKFTLDDGFIRETVFLDKRSEGLVIEGLVWREMTEFSPDCVLLVLASEHYDENDYIRNYSEFLAMARG